MSGLERDTVLASLRAEDVISHVGIVGRWHGRWLRSARCATQDHSSDAFAISRTGFFHCHACDTGGDLLKLIALAKGLDVRTDFRAVLEIAADIACVRAPIEDDFGGAPVRAAPIARPPLPPLPSNEERIALARKRAAWAWGRLQTREELSRSSADAYLRDVRRLPPDVLRAQEEIRETYMRVSQEECQRAPDLERLRKLFAAPGLAIPVRSPKDGALVDIRVRRFEPREDQPKIIGMLGGVTSLAAADMNARELVGCYGMPHQIDHDLVVVVEGLVDYLTALAVWPNARVLGAVDGGSLSLVVGVAAHALAARDDSSRLLIVEQNDGAPKAAGQDGHERARAADRSVNEDPNSAAKVAIRTLGARRVGWLFCDLAGDDFGGAPPIKDLNDLWRSGRAPAQMIRWWREVGEAA